jgi:PleD family two-component response regulator
MYEAVAARFAGDPRLGGIALTITSGVAALTPEMKSAEDIIRVADDDLLAKKRALGIR